MVYDLSTKVKVEEIDDITRVLSIIVFKNQTYKRENIFAYGKGKIIFIMISHSQSTSIDRSIAKNESTLMKSISSTEEKRNKIKLLSSHTDSDNKVHPSFTVITS